MFCKNCVGEACGTVFFYILPFFLNFLSYLFLCLPIFINFSVLLLSPVRWSLIVVVWRDFKLMDSWDKTN